MITMLVSTLTQHALLILSSAALSVVAL